MSTSCVVHASCSSQALPYVAILQQPSTTLRGYPAASKLYLTWLSCSSQALPYVAILQQPSTTLRGYIVTPPNSPVITVFDNDDPIKRNFYKVNFLTAEIKVNVNSCSYSNRIVCQYLHIVLLSLTYSTLKFIIAVRWISVYRHFFGFNKLDISLFYYWFEKTLLTSR